MSPSTSLGYPDTPPTPPPIVQAILLVLSVLITSALIAFIGFIAFEFGTEMTGHPLYFEGRTPLDGELLPGKQDMERELKEAFELISPRHQTQIQGPEVVVIYTERTMPTVLPELRVNGTQYPWEVQFGNHTWFARLHLPEGMQHVRVGEAEADIFVVMPNSAQRSPEIWSWNIPHQGTNDVARCGDCHEVSPMPNQERTIGIWKGALSCFACHDEEQHAIVHRVVLSITDRSPRCVRCHAIH